MLACMGSGLGQGMAEGAGKFPPLNARRVVLGFVLTPLLVPFVFLGHDLIVAGLPALDLSRFFELAKKAYVPALALGVPAYLLLRQRVYLSWGVCLLVAGLIGCSVGLILDVALNDFRPQPLSTRALIYGATFLTGAVHGLLFWLIVIFRDEGYRTGAPRRS